MKRQSNEGIMLNPSTIPQINKGGTMAKKTSGGTKPNNSKTAAKQTNSSPKGKGKGKGKGEGKGKGKSGTLVVVRSNPTFAAISGTVKQTMIGSGGAIVSKVGSDVGLSIVDKFAPQITDHAAVRPIATGLFAYFVTPRIFKMIGVSNQSAEVARVGGLIAAGLQVVEVIFPDAQDELVRKLRSITGGNGNGAIEAAPKMQLQPQPAPLETRVAAEVGKRAAEIVREEGGSREAAIAAGAGAAQGAMGALRGGIDDDDDILDE